jgi:dynein heavy chain
MFLFTRIPNPKFSPELSAKTLIIDFTVTQTGLEQQLLGRVLSKEQKQLEINLKQLLQKCSDNKKALLKLDEKLLLKLTSSTGNLIEDTELVQVLNETKTSAKEVANLLSVAE